jgi:ABC-type polysaccharide/polyol phosphate export permease
VDWVERRSLGGEPLRLATELRDLRGRGALLYELVHRDLTIRYKRSALGFAWTMLHPLIMMLIFTMVFSRVFGRTTPHYETYFLSAYLAWNFFAQTLVNAMASVGWNGRLMKRVRVPATIFPLSTSISSTINYALALIVLFAIMLVVGAPIHATALFLPVSVAIMFVFTFGMSLALTALVIFFADVREMVQAALPAIMFLTPVVYPFATIPARFRSFLIFNPLLYVLGTVRDPIYYGVIPPPATIGIAAIASVVSVVIGWLIFRRMAPHFHAHL